MSQPKLALEYFNAQGRAEVARAAFWIGGVEFDDVRISHEQFAANKAAGKYPRGQVPVLSVDGEVIPQSSAIVRYAATRAGIHPTDPLLALRVDSYNESINDLVLAVAATFYVSDEERQALRQKIAQDKLPELLGYFQKAVAGKKFLVGDQLTTADLSLLIVVKGWVSSGILDHIPATVIDSFPGLLAYFAALEEVPAIQKYRAASEAAKKAVA